MYWYPLGSKLVIQFSEYKLIYCNYNWVPKILHERFKYKSKQHILAKMADLPFYRHSSFLNIYLLHGLAES